MIVLVPEMHEWCRGDMWSRFGSVGLVVDLGRTANLMGRGIGPRAMRGCISVTSGGRNVPRICDAVGAAETRCISSLLMHLSLSLSLFASPTKS